MAGLASRPARRRRGLWGTILTRHTSGHDGHDRSLREQTSYGDTCDLRRKPAPLALWTPEPYGAFIWLVPAAAALISVYAGIVSCTGYDPLMTAWAEWVLSAPGVTACTACFVADAGATPSPAR